MSILKDIGNAWGILSDGLAIMHEKTAQARKQVEDEALADTEMAERREVRRNELKLLADNKRHPIEDYEFDGE